MESKTKHIDIIKIDFILDLEIWVILQQSDQEAADCNHVSEREKEYNISEGKDNTTKRNLQVCIYMFQVIIHWQLNPELFLCFHFVYVATNKSELQKFWGVQNLQGLSDIAKIELKLVLFVGTKDSKHTWMQCKKLII